MVLGNKECPPGMSKALGPILCTSGYIDLKLCNLVSGDAGPCNLKLAL